MEKFLFEQSHFLSTEFALFLKKHSLFLANWQWGILLLGWVLAISLRPLLQFALKKIKEHNLWAKKFPKSFIAYFFGCKVEKPLAWILVILFWFGLNDSIELTGNFLKYYEHVLKALMAFQIMHLAYFGVDALGDVLKDMASKTENTMDDYLVPFANKTLKILVVVLGILIVLQSFGLNVMSLMAGLGLGGLALALAAQDTAANLFGSITILIDSPFKIGDWVKVQSMEGTVEEIGFRSTRIRTFYNSVITVPNALMAKETIDNMGVRPYRRVRQVLGVTYETTPEKIEHFCDNVRYFIKQHEKVNPDTVLVNFNGYADSQLNVLVQFHLQVFSGPEEFEHQQKIFLQILKIASEMKVDFAYPTQTVYYRGGGAN